MLTFSPSFKSAGTQISEFSVKLEGYIGSAKVFQEPAVNTATHTPRKQLGACVLVMSHYLYEPC